MPPDRATPQRSNGLHRIHRALETVMSLTTHPLPQVPASRPVDPQPARAHGLARWLLRWWQAECRRAERPDRFVPYL
jgi:hypothetical protein